MADQYLYRIQPVRGEMLTEGPTPEEEANILMNPQGNPCA